MSEALHDLVDYIVRSLVDHPEAVRVQNIGAPDATVLELRVAQDDLGKVIGKKGATARAIRAVLFAASANAKDKRRAILNIVEESL